MEEIRKVDTIHIYDEAGDGPDGGEPLVFDLNDVTFSAGETIDIAWDKQGIIRVEP